MHAAESRTWFKPARFKGIKRTPVRCIGRFHRLGHGFILLEALQAVNTLDAPGDSGLQAGNHGKPQRTSEHQDKKPPARLEHFVISRYRDLLNPNRESTTGRQHEIEVVNANFLGVLCGLCGFIFLFASFVFRPPFRFPQIDLE
jgi:hypothetical protein